MLESIMIKIFTSGLRDDRSRERVILQTPKTLTEAAQYARFSEAAVRVARGHSAPPQSTSVNAMNFSYRHTRDSVVAHFLEASAEEAVLSPEEDIISQIRTSTEGVVKDPFRFTLRETLTPMEEQSDIVAEEAFSVSIAVGWDTWRKIALPLDNNNSDSADHSAVGEQGTASVP